MAQERILHHEILVSYTIFALFFLIALILFWIGISLPGGFLAFTLSSTVVLAVLIIVIIIGINFSIMYIKITPKYMIVSFGVFKKVIAWESIVNYWIDKTPALTYGGFGIRFARMNGKRVLAYIVEMKERIALELEGHTAPIFVFSTKDPDKILEIIKNKTGK
ncbi:hypothetical protein [Candidatus Aciduliprofundum boonei]|uniref:Bacterial Pleckstrin homology domain-containing protein n=1 Tax=Aciduliprofundum boonei (strain DSM 19572 / T469) TaxID=439481 RepID=B5I9U3_ACIB4|nr:hypothetical protein [Candidatus Aciduliprofundum boonei]ADD08426.1 hypothetical protein Aboo_0615 [Aciduliprofundum boonei T469]EDY37090.1 hypothetical protein ABOONEI_2011 [Aciduliprofundum boonei T469]HII55469.1 hypothetical protein [Candidatus Aciduliprofundum boonei]